MNTLSPKRRKKLSDVLIGYLDPSDEVPTSQEIAEAQAAKNEKSDDDEDESDETGPDPDEAKIRFDESKTTVK